MLIDVSPPAPEASEALAADLEPPDHLLEESRGSERRAQLRLMLTKRNRVSMTPPLVKVIDEPVDPDVLARLDLPAMRRDFLLVLTTVTCMPDPGCRFNWLRVQFELGPGLPEESRPVACRLYPESSQDNVRQVRTVEVHADLSIDVATVAGPSLGRTRTTTTEVDGVRHRVMTFGRYGSEPAWHFARTEVTPEVGGDLFLALAVAAPAGSAGAATASLSAEVQLRDSPIALPLLTRRSADNALTREFRLSPSSG